MYEDVASNPGVNGMVGYIVGGVMRGAQRARQKPCILHRLLLIVQALLLNTNLHLGPQNYVSLWPSVECGVHCPGDLELVVVVVNITNSYLLMHTSI